MGYDFQLETKLAAEAPELHRIFSDNVLCVQNMLMKYKAVFPNYTDHTALHSLEVIAFCNELVGENIGKLNPDEIFVLLMAAYLHDSGMGISRKDYERFSAEMPHVMQYRNEHPEATLETVVRNFHNDFSGKYIAQYAPIFDFPSEAHLFAVIQTSRGHRKTDLFNETEYPHEWKVPNGSIIHLPYLAALIRLADELDIAADRNIQFLYDVSALTSAQSVKEFQKHLAIKRLEFEPDALKAYVAFSEYDISEELEELFCKLNDTLVQCVDVVEQCTPFTIAQRVLKVQKI